VAPHLEWNVSPNLTEMQIPFESGERGETKNRAARKRQPGRNVKKRPSSLLPTGSARGRG